MRKTRGMIVNIFFDEIRPPEKVLNHQDLVISSDDSEKVLKVFNLSKWLISMILFASIHPVILVHLVHDVAMDTAMSSV